MQKLILIDGNAILHRAFHALPLFKTSTGEYTNAIYGFLKMFMDLLRKEKPAYLAIAFDRAAKTFRHTEYEAYKATRKPPPDELYPQLPRLKEVLEAFHTSIFELDGYEADDILGTLVNSAEERGDLQTIIVTGDRDALQLVTAKTHVMVPVKGVSEVIDFTPEEVESRTGLKPAQIIDYKALKGDTSDNIKGIAGIGDKQAVALLQKYGNLETIYQHLEELPPGQRKKMEEGKEDALFSKRLATIIRNVPIKIDLELCRFRKADYAKVQALFEKLQFKGLLKKLEEINDIIDGKATPTHEVRTSTGLNTAFHGKNGAGQTGQEAPRGGMQQSLF